MMHMHKLSAFELVKARTEELLYVLLWTCEMFGRPTFRNLTDSFESWAYRKGLHRQLARLERQKFLEAAGERLDDRAYRLTDTGRLRCLGGRDPQTCWQRSWDGRWRLVLFDFPLARNVARNRLRSYLRSRGFGYLQNSVWLTPDPLVGERDLLASGEVNVESLILLEARPCAGETDQEIVAGAWSFPFINERYDRYLEVLAERPDGKLSDEGEAKTFQRWLRCERLAWLEAISVDPLLPECLLPTDYRGMKAWEARRRAAAKVASQMQRFTT